MPFKRTGGLLYSEQNCNEMAAARGSAIAERNFVEHPFERVARERDVLINMVTSMEQIESFDRVRERKTETSKIIHMSVLIILIVLHSQR